MEINTSLEDKMKRLFIASLVLFSIVGCSSTSDGRLEEDQTTYKTIEIEQVEEYMEEGYKLVDVREIEEYNSGHIPGALNVPLSDIQQGKFGPLIEDEKYVIICRSGNRSVTASNILSEQKFEVVNVKEGMSSWTGDIEQ